MEYNWRDLLVNDLHGLHALVRGEAWDLEDPVWHGHPAAVAEGDSTVSGYWTIGTVVDYDEENGK